MKITLYVLSGAQIGNTFELHEGSVLGRAPTCAPRLAVALRESSVSRNHARVVREGEQWFLEDQGSSNGTFFGNKRVRRHELHDQEEFRLGELELRVRMEAESGAVPLASPNERPAPEPRKEPEPTDYDEIELEEEIELEPEPAPRAKPAPSPAPPRPAPPAPGAGARDLARTKLTRPSSTDEPQVKRKVLQYNRVENRSGLFATDMAQWPPLVQGLMVLLALAVFAGLVYGAYMATQIMSE